MKKKRRIYEKVALALLCAAIILVFFFPLYVLVNVSLREFTDLSSRLIPTKNPIPDNYREILENPLFWKALRNTCAVFLLDVLFQIPIASIAGYGLARSQGRIVNMIRSFNILVMMLPGTALLVGTYSLMTKLHLTNSLVGLALLEAGTSMTGAMFFYTTFSTMIPVDLDDAAAIDGAGVIRTYFQIILPQMKAITVTRIISLLIVSFNSYLMPLYLLTKADKYTVLLFVRKIFASSNAVADIPLAFASCMIMIAPMLLLYFLLQKQIIGSQLDSAVKG